MAPYKSPNQRLVPQHEVLLLLVAIVTHYMVSSVTGFHAMHSRSFAWSITRCTTTTTTTTTARRTVIVPSSNRNDDEAKQQQPGMDEAFRQLEALSSLDDPEEYIPAPEKIQFDPTAWKASTLDPTDTTAGTFTAAKTTTTATATSGSIEQDFAVYKDMVQELERNEDAEAYADMVNELGGSNLQTDDTYSQIMLDLGGTATASSRSSSISSSSSGSSTTRDLPTDVASSSDDTATLSTQDFMEQALKEALSEVKVNNPLVSQSIILDDKEIMKEIEEIFEQGNAKLMASLEEIRNEQQALAAASATTKAAQTAGTGEISKDGAATRYQNAARSMTTMLQRVDAEKVNVEQAVSDLKAASDAVDRDVLYQLKRGGLPKQLSLVGFVLFAVRSIVDSVASVSASDESYLLAALAQGAVAIACAAIFVLLK